MLIFRGVPSFIGKLAAFRLLNPMVCLLLAVGKAAVLPWRFSELDARHLLEKAAVLRDFRMGCTWTPNGAPFFFCWTKVPIFWGVETSKMEVIFLLGTIMITICKKKGLEEDFSTPFRGICFS